MNSKNNVKIVKFLTLLVSVFILVLLVFKTSYTLLSNSINEGFRINKTTSSYLSFNYEKNDSSIFEIENPKVISDFKGKKLLNDYFDFEVSIPKKYVISDIVEYDIVVKGLGNNIDERFIKFYLTDQDNNSLEGYEEAVPVYTALSDNVDGKVIYTGFFTKKDLNDKYRLRIWISNSYNKKFKSNLAYQITIKLK